MNLTWHIVKKDLRSLKWPLLLWTLLIVAKLGVGVMLLNSDTAQGKDWFLKMDALGKILGGLECVSFVLVAAFIQEDMLVGTTSFWMTRPISGARLMQAKLAGIGVVFLFVPVMVTLPWWLGCGYGMGEITWAALETVAVHAIFVLLGLLWSVVTDGFARFLAWTLVTLFAIPTLTTTLVYYVTDRGQHGPNGDVTATRMAIGVVLAIIGVGVVVVHQFLTRRTVRSIGTIGGVAGVIILVGVFAPWSWHIEQQLYGYLFKRAEGDWPASAEPAGLKFTLEPAKLEPINPSKRMLHGAFRVEGLSENETLLADWSWSTSWQWPDGTSKQSPTWSVSDLDDLISRRAMGLVTKSGYDGQYRDVIRTRAVVSQEMAKKLLATPPAYTLETRFRLMKFESIATVAPQPGPRSTRGVLTERIAQVEKDGEELLVTVVRSNPSLLADNAVGRAYPSGHFAQYLLVNRARDFVDRGRPQNRLSTRIGTVEITWQTTAYRASPKAGGLRPSIEAINALEDAKLTRVLFREQARFTHEIKTDAFVTEPSAP